MIRAEGNYGGDYIELSIVPRKGRPPKHPKRDMVHLKIGHCCVVYVDRIIPVEVLTAILARELDDYKKAEDINLPWDEKFTTELKTLIMRR